MAFSLYEFANKKESDLALSGAIIALLREYLSLYDGVNLALSGGKSPIEFFEILSREDCDWEKCNISLVDERIVALSNADSNANLIRTYFLKNLAKKSNFQAYFDDPNLPLNELVNRANASYKQPDIAILGMGLDGHTASLFPEAKEFEWALQTEQNIISISPKNAPYKRLSMSLFALENCKKIFLSIATKEKKEVLNQALKGIDSALPISYILHSKKVVCDVYFSQ